MGGGILSPREAEAEVDQAPNPIPTLQPGAKWEEGELQIHRAPGSFQQQFAAPGRLLRGTRQGFALHSLLHAKHAGSLQDPAVLHCSAAEGVGRQLSPSSTAAGGW